MFSTIVLVVIEASEPTAKKITAAKIGNKNLNFFKLFGRITDFKSLKKLKIRQIGDLPNLVAEKNRCSLVAVKLQKKIDAETEKNSIFSKYISKC
jgi:hypothetical protein